MLTGPINEEKPFQTSVLWPTDYIFGRVHDITSHDSLDQCPKPINADQNTGIDPKCLSMLIIAYQFRSIPLNHVQLRTVAVHLGVKMADTLSFTAKVDMVDF